MATVSTKRDCSSSISSQCADVVGAIPHFEFTREYGVQSLHIAFDLAKKYDRPLDIHCDEIAISSQ